MATQLRLETEETMKSTAGKRNFFIGAALAALIVALGVGQSVLQNKADAQGRTVQAPMFEVDPLWPKPLPNHWLLGWTIGVWVDEQDHIWIIHRGAGGLHNNERGLELDPPISECCRTAPPILEFDQAGNLLQALGRTGTGLRVAAIESRHPHRLQRQRVDRRQRPEGRPGPEVHQGRQVPDAGRPHAARMPAATTSRISGGVAKIWVDPKTNEAYIADGYGNKRVAVIDADTGKMKRYWGAYGNRPDDADLGKYDPKAPPAQQFRNPVHCVERSNDGLVYVCDRQADRVQVFQPDGKFVKEAFYAKETLGSGSAWDITFSKDPQQRFMFLADGQNEKVRIILRETLEELTNFGDGGRQPGQFYGVHSIATDSKGNLYTTETYEGKRVQKFVYKGIGTVAAGSQGVLWPK